MTSTPTSSPSASRFISAGILAAFFFSGMASLIHEVAWTRLLRLVMGNTTYTITTVLCVFMGGLALGAYLGGRLMKKRNDSLRWFAILEGVIGLYCLFLPEIIDAAEPLYRTLYQSYHDNYLLSLIRFALSCLLLVIPATIMGATLPILSRHFVRGSAIGMPIATLYAVNSFGAVAGAATAGFLLIPNLGVNQTIIAGSCLNFAVFIVGYALFLKDKRDAANQQAPVIQPAAPDTITYAPIVMRILLIGYGLAGFSSLAYEIAWTRVLSSMIGSSVYAFSMMLSAFILGLASGSLIFGRFVDRIKDPLRALAYIQAAIGLSALLVVPLIGQLPYITTSAIAHFSGSFAQLQLVEFGIILMVMLVPTTLMGASFPLASRIYIKKQKAVPQAVGTVYASNTIGTIVGSFAGGFILIPVFHIQSTILIAVFANILVACAFIRFGAQADRQQQASRLVLALIAIFAIGAIAIPRWDISRMSIGPFEQGRFLYQGRSTESAKRIDQLADAATILYHNEGVATTVTMKEFNFPGEPPQLTLFVNGKADASSGSDMPTQILSGQIPMLLHPDPKDVLVIGLASGITLGAAATFDDAQTLDCAEISPGVEEACKLFFAPYNHNVTEDPRVDIINTDGRNHVALTDKTYDVIISEPSNPWIAGIGDLFTQEFFQSARNRLSDDGILLIWFDVYNNRAANFASILNTFRSVFPEMRLFCSVEGADFLLVGSKAPFDVPYDRLVQRMNQPKVAADLKRIGIETPADLLGHLAMGPSGIKAFSKEAPIVTDDNALLEFSIPRVMANMKPGPNFLEGFDEYRDPDFEFIQSPIDSTWPEITKSYELTLALAAETQANKTRRIISGSQLANAKRMMAENEPKEKTLELFRKSALGAPLELELRSYIGQQVAVANQLLSEGQIDLALQIANDLVYIQPNNPHTRVLLGLLLHNADRLDEALEQFNHFLTLNPYSREALLLVGRTQEGLFHFPAAVEAYTRALELEANSFNALVQLTWILAAAPESSLRDSDTANAYARRADALARRSYAAALDEFGHALATDNQLPQAIQVVTIASQLVANLGEIEPGITIRKNLENYNNDIRPQPLSGSFSDIKEILNARRSFAEQAQLEYAQALDAVGAARAAAGEYAQAVEAASLAIQFIQSPQPESPLIPQIQARMELYQNNQPYRLPTSKDTTPTPTSKPTQN